MSKKLSKVQKVVKKFVTPGKKPNINSGAIVKKSAMVQRKKKAVVQ
jgi:hypothetical protein